MGEGRAAVVFLSFSCLWGKVRMGANRSIIPSPDPGIITACHPGLRSGPTTPRRPGLRSGPITPRRPGLRSGIQRLFPSISIGGFCRWASCQGRLQRAVICRIVSTGTADPIGIGRLNWRGKRSCFSIFWSGKLVRLCTLECEPGRCVMGGKVP